MKLNYSFEISDEAFELLNNIHRLGYAEYRDPEWPTLDDFLKWRATVDAEVYPESWYINRNFGGTYHLADELYIANLIDNDSNAWHTTFRLNDFGRSVLEQNKI